MRKSLKIQDRCGKKLFYDRFKNTDLLQSEKTERKYFLLVLKAYSKKYDCHILPFLCSYYKNRATDIT